LKILVDTNILISASCFPDSKPSKALKFVVDRHELVLCDQNIHEFRDVIKRKFPKMYEDSEIFLAELSYELIPAIKNTQKTIRDAKDQPILNSAILNGIDMILTGDKDFLSLELEIPRCLTVSDFLDQYC